MSNLSDFELQREANIAAAREQALVRRIEEVGELEAAPAPWAPEPTGYESLSKPQLEALIHDCARLIDSGMGTPALAEVLAATGEELSKR